MMVICSLDALKKSSKKKETETEKEIAEVLQQASDCIKKTVKERIGMMKFLARLTMTLTSEFA